MATAALTVLVVEDEALIRMDIAEHLDSEGFIVIEAADADEAIRILSARSDIAILFTDIDMPGSMNGCKLAAAVRHRWPAVKIIIASGHHKVATDCPSDALFFAKPYSHGKIAEALRTLAVS